MMKPSTKPLVLPRLVQFSTRSRLVLWVSRYLLRPLVAWMARGSLRRLTALQLHLASRMGRDAQRWPLPPYRVIGSVQQPVPGHVIGELDPARGPVLLYLHGGAFVLPAIPEVHLRFVMRLSQALGASAFVPDYRLSPSNPFPAGLDDCERAYRALMELGFEGRQIVLAGESAGGNLSLGLLQRIRAAQRFMPCCAVVISPATDLARLHNPPSRNRLAKRDAMLDLASLADSIDAYAGAHDRRHPELSPLNADFGGFPPLMVIASDAELLCDDSLLLAERARSLGAEMHLSLWQGMPHAFPLLEDTLPEAAPARQEVADFMMQALQSGQP